MCNKFKKLLSAALSLAIIAGSIVVPAAVNAEESALKSWKFDFGASATDGVEDGYIGVTPDKNYMDAKDYGFLGIDENGHKLGDRHDGFGQQEGQIIQLQAGGGSGLLDGIGSVGKDESNNAGDKYYPVRFAVKADDETYYKIKATVTTLDPAKPATASLYTERKHPLYTEKTIPAGEAVETEFTIRVTPIYYEKSDPKGAWSDGMINVCVLGENTALAALEIQQLDTATTLWVVGDSTVTDGGGSLPFFPLQNYTGVGTGLTKYLPSNIAMVNEGEGGLNANDSYHFNMIKDRIAAGDYLYVEYGHNHKSAVGRAHVGDWWTNDYLKALPKYYNACKDARGGAATLIVVGPIDRHNEGQYNATTNTWSSTLKQFSDVGKGYVDCLKYGGETLAASYLAKWQEISDYADADANRIPEYNSKGELSNYHVKDEAKPHIAELMAEADKIVADAMAGEANGVSNVAFVDLNQPSLDWMTEVTKSGTIKNTLYTNKIELTDYYFKTAKNDKATDGTHPNDTGAENLAYYFFTTADTEAYPAIKPLLANFALTVNADKAYDNAALIYASYDDGVLSDLSIEKTALTAGTQSIPIDSAKTGKIMLWDGLSSMNPIDCTAPTHELPTPVSPEIINMDYAGKSDAWPTYIPPIHYEYPIVIKDITFDENNQFISMKTLTQTRFSNYALGVVEIYNADGTLKESFTTNEHLDNTNGTGTNVLTFSAGKVLADGETYKAYMWSCYMDREELIPEEDGGEQLSAFYVPTDVAAYLLPGDDNSDVETFDYYGQTTLDGSGKYSFKGSSVPGLTLGTDTDADKTTYVNITSDGAGSFFLRRAFENLKDGTQTSGRYMIDVNAIYNSGQGMNFGFCRKSNNSSPYVEDQFTAFTIGKDGVVTAGGKEIGSISASKWTNIKYILDMDAGIAEISVAGGTPKQIDIPDYQTFDTPPISTLAYFLIEGSRVAFDVKLSNMTVAKLKDNKATSTITAGSDAESTGTGKILINNEEAANNTATVSKGSTVTVEAVPDSDSSSKFVGWYDTNGDLYSTESTLTLRLYKDFTVNARFIVGTETSVTLHYVDENDQTIKEDVVVSKDDNGYDLMVGHPFTVAGVQYLGIVKKDTNDGDNTFYLYNYDSENTQSLTIDELAAENNELTLKYKKAAGTYIAYEDNEMMTTDALKTSGWSSSTDHLTVKNDNDDYGNYVYLWDSANKARNAKYTIPTFTPTKPYVYEMDFALVQGNKETSANLAVIAADSTLAEYTASGKYLFKLTPTGKASSGTTSLDWYVNDSTTEKITLAQQGINSATWAHLKLAINPTDKSVTATVTQNGTQLLEKTYTVDSSCVLTGFVNQQARDYPKSSFDNIKVYYPNEEPIE